MTEAASDHSDSKYSLDDLFQLLVHARGVVPDTKAKGEILSALQRGDLQVDFHIRGGARSVRLIAPPEGITGRVHRESWEPGRVFSLTIKDDCLNVLPNCALDYPWTDYSFPIANWWMVDKLWPPKAEQEPSSSKPGSADAWIDKLHPNDWQLFTARKIHQEAGRAGCKLSLRTFQRTLANRRRR
jgi:hypothetical protein